MGRKKKKKQALLEPVIPVNLTANITPSMRVKQSGSSSEVFENSPTKTPVKKEGSPTKKRPPRAKEVQLTGFDDLRSFEVDLVATYTHSSGAISYMSSPSTIIEADLRMIIEEDGISPEFFAPLHQSEVEQLASLSGPKSRSVLDAEWRRKICVSTATLAGEEPEPKAEVNGADWEMRENVLTKTIISEAVDEFFASDREDVEMVVRLSRRDALPTVHFTFGQLPEPARPSTIAWTDKYARPFFHRRVTRVKIDDDVSSDNLMKSMEEQSAAMCTARWAKLPSFRSFYTVRRAH